MTAPRKAPSQEPYRLPANALARIEELVACAPPLSEGQKRLIQRTLGPVVARIAAEHAAESPHQAA